MREVKAELRSFAGLVPLLKVASWNAEWNRSVCQSDASDTVYGVSVAE